MRIVEIILVVIFCLGAIFKINHYPGGSVLLIVSVCNLALLYGLFSFILLNGIKARHMFKKKSYEKISAFRVLGSIALGFGIWTLMLGVLFKVQMYPGAAIMMLVGFVGTLIPLSVFMLRFVISSSDFIKNNLIRLVPIVLIGSFFYSVSSDDIIDYNWGAGTEYSELKKELVRNPDNYEARSRLDELDREKGRR